MVETVGAPLAVRELPALFERLHQALAARRDAIDDLNVFPVPDGDTGTNMVATVSAALTALREAAAAEPRPDPDELVRAVVRGAVRGARGNSGVILSQVVRAVVEVVADQPQVDARLYAAALGRARDLAYEAVAEPVEGTILTVIGVAADAAEAAAARGHDLVATSAAVCDAVGPAVARTRDQLDVLRTAGVVDAGARGLEVLLAAVHGHLTGEDPPVVLDPPRRGRADAAGGCHAVSGEPFEVQYLLTASDDAAAPLRRSLEELGDSVVVVAAGGLLNVHVHTARIGPAIEAGLAHGRPEDIEVTYLDDEIVADRTDHGHDATRATVVAVAVVAGRGLRALARRMGAVTVEGAAGALPSVADLVDAIATVDAERVLLLPGHPNAVAAATTAARMSAMEAGHRLDVVEAATSPPAVLAGLAVMDRDAPPAEVLDAVRAAVDGVRVAEVVDAVRDAQTPIGHIVAGRPLAVVGGEVVAAGRDHLDALRIACEHLRVADAELVTLLHGAGTDRAQRRAAVDLVTSLTDADLDVVDADVRPATFWIGAE